jgi:hypothetical protein
MTTVRDDPAEPDVCQIVIRPDGQVAFQMFTRDLLEVAQTLAPDDPRLRARARKRGANDAEPGAGD